MKVLSLVERDGKQRSFHIANVTAENVTPILKKHIAKRSRLRTDEAKVYNAQEKAHFDAMRWKRPKTNAEPVDLSEYAEERIPFDVVIRKIGNAKPPPPVKLKQRARDRK